MFEKLKLIFYSLIATFIILLSFFIIPFSDTIRQTLFPFAGIFALIFLILGIILIYLTIKSKIEKRPKIYLFMTGGAASAFLVGTILHNLFYGVGIYFSHIHIIKYITDFLHGTFFLISIPISPILFLVGAIKTFMFFVKKKE